MIFLEKEVSCSSLLLYALYASAFQYDVIRDQRPSIQKGYHHLVLVRFNFILLARPSLLYTYLQLSRSHPLQQIRRSAVKASTKAINVFEWTYDGV